MGIGVLEPWHLIIILVIVLVIFGPGKLPSIGRAVGDSVRELKKATHEDDAKPSEATPAAPSHPPVAAIQTQSERACRQCQAPMPAGARFCGTCGAPSMAAPL